MKENDKSKLEYFIKNPRRGLIKMTLPVLAGMLIHNLYHLVDMIFVGKISSLAIAAIAFNFPLVFLIYGISFGLGSGVTAIISRYIGAKDKKNAENAANHGLYLGFFVGLLFSFTGILFNKTILKYMGIPSEIIAESSSYLLIISFGFFITSITIMFRSIFTGEGNTKTPMIYQSLGAVLNIALDPIFILLLKMGVQGAATATIISQLVVLFLFYNATFKNKILFLVPDIRNFNYNSNIFFSILKIGIPVSLSMIIMSLGAGVFNSLIARFSAKAVAGYQIALEIEQVFFLPVLALSMSVVTMTGMFYGAKRKDLLLKLLKFSIAVTVMIGLFFSVLFYFITPSVFYIFTKDAYVIDIADSYLNTLLFIYPLVALGVTLGRFLQGLGSSLPMLLFTASRVLLISVPLSYLFLVVYNKSIEWMWYSMVIASCFSTFLALIYLLRRISKLKLEFK